MNRPQVLQSRRFEEATALISGNEALGTDTSGEGDVPRFDRDAE